MIIAMPKQRQQQHSSLNLHSRPWSNQTRLLLTACSSSVRSSVRPCRGGVYQSRKQFVRAIIDFNCSNTFTFLLYVRSLSLPLVFAAAATVDVRLGAYFPCPGDFASLSGNVATIYYKMPYPLRAKFQLLLPWKWWALLIELLQRETHILAATTTTTTDMRLYV